MFRNLAVNLLAKENLAQSTRKVNSLLYKLGTQLLIDRNFPLHIYLELSRSCNYNCPMCVRDKVNFKEGFMEEWLVRKITEEAKEYGATSFSLHLFGEPLLHSYWYNLVKVIREANPKNVILLTTNGSMMDEDCIRKLVELKVDRVFVSVHSFIADHYKIKTGDKGNIKVIIRNLESFRDLVGINQKPKLTIRKLSFGNSYNFPINPRFPIEQRNYHNFGGSKDEWTPDRLAIKRYPCYHPWFTLGVTFNGEVSPCCVDYNSQIQVGDAKTQTIKQIWRGQRIKFIREEHLQRRFNNLKFCKNCDGWRFHPNMFW